MNRTAMRLGALLAVMLVGFLAVGTRPAAADKPTVITKTHLSWSFVFDCGIYDLTWSEVLVSVDVVIPQDIFFAKDGSVYREIQGWNSEVTWENLVTGTTATGGAHGPGIYDAEAVASGYVEGTFVYVGEQLRMQRDDHAMFQEAGWELFIDGNLVGFHGTADLTYQDFCAFMN